MKKDRLRERKKWKEKVKNMSKKKIWFKNIITVIEAIWSTKKNLIWSDLISKSVSAGWSRKVCCRSSTTLIEKLSFFFLSYVCGAAWNVARSRFFFFWLELVAHVFRFFIFFSSWTNRIKFFLFAGHVFFWPLATIYVIQDHKVGQNETKNKKINRVKKQWIYQMMVVVVKGHHHHNHNHQRRRTKYIIIIIKCMNAGYP